MKYQRISADELFAAIKIGSRSIVGELVSRDSSVAESRDDSGMSALLCCLYEWNFEMLEILLAAAPRLDIFEAAALGRKDRVAELLACQPRLAFSWSADGVTPLHLACFYGQEEVAGQLLECGADPSAGARNDGGETPLHEAAVTGQLNILMALLTHGADVDAANHDGLTAMDVAASHGHLDIVETLMHFRDALYRNREGLVPRPLAPDNGYHETVKA
jgi:ankyrin repeat protein